MPAVEVCWMQSVRGTSKIPTPVRVEVLQSLDLAWRRFLDIIIQNSFQKHDFTEDHELHIDIALDLI